METVDSVIARLILAYQEKTNKTLLEIALDFDVTLSNLYRYREQGGNPPCEDHR